MHFSRLLSGHSIKPTVEVSTSFNLSWLRELVIIAIVEIERKLSALLSLSSYFGQPC